MRGNLRLILLCLAVVCLVYLCINSCDIRTFGMNLDALNDLYVQNASEHTTGSAVSSTERQNIFFLKTHKCGSSTVQNILMRYGYSRHLDFVLPEKNNYLGHPAPFEAKFISPKLLKCMMPNQTFDVFTHHTRYNYSAIKAVMKPDTAFVTILRKPSDLFESLFAYYHIEKYVNGTKLSDVIKNPAIWQVLKNRTSGRKFGANQMSFDLGFDFKPVKLGENDPVKEFIAAIEEEFDLVMIMEYMEVSLVLLCDLMNWPLEYVVFLQLNARPSKVVQLTPTEKQKLLELNLIDTELYEHFLEKFKQRVMNFGPDRMKNSVDKLLKLNSDLWRNCVDKPNRSGYARTLGYDLRNKDFLCFFATSNELQFTDLIRNDQIRRFSAMRNLEELVAE